RLESAVACTGDGATVTTVVEESIDRFLQHALLVPDNDIRSLELKQVLETVVPVDDTTVKIVQIGSRETTSLKRHERTQVGRDDSKHFDNHPLGTSLRIVEALGQLEAFGQFFADLL